MTKKQRREMRNSPIGKFIKAIAEATKKEIDSRKNSRLTVANDK